MKRPAPEHGCLPGDAPAAAADSAAGPIANRLPTRRVTAGLLLAAPAPALTRGGQRGARWSGWSAFLIGAASAPQASASGFSAAYTIPDGATAALGVLVA